MANDRDLGDLKPAEILAAVREVAKTREGGFESYHIADAVAKSCDSSTQNIVISGRQRGYILDAYYGRLKRALDKLAEAGELERYGADTITPDRKRTHRTVVYFTPAEAEKARKKAAGEAEKANELKLAWDVVYGRMRALGIEPNSNGGLGLTDWMRLLDLAEEGADHGSA
jgi:hypothetical protein